MQFAYIMSPLPILLFVHARASGHGHLTRLLDNDFQIVSTESRCATLQWLEKQHTAPDLILLDLDQTLSQDATEPQRFIAELLAMSPRTKICALCSDKAESRARLMPTSGVFDLIEEPSSPSSLRASLYRALQHEPDIQHPEISSPLLIGLSPLLKTLRDQIALYSTLPFPVLIEGESGSGKELIAMALHESGLSNSNVFKAINCAAISPALLDSTLFGHSKGAYTGAYHAHPGFFEDAENGTLFLDEIGELPLDMQANLLRVLENGEYQRVGETTTRKSRARIIAATNRNLKTAVQEGRFRADLYHRINVFSISAPALRELGMDKLLLLHHFRMQYAQQFKLQPFELHAQALDIWEQYAFPGNTRELRNIVLRLTAKYSGKKIRHEQLLAELDSQGFVGASDQPLRVRQKIQSGHFDLDHELRTQENLFIDTALELAAHNISSAARMLGINRTTLYSRIGAYEKSRLSG